MTTFLNRPLTAREEALRAAHLCIGCEGKVKPVRLRRESDGKREWTYPLECRDCQRTRTQSPTGATDDPRAPDWGAKRATAASQGPRLMGYHPPRDGGGRRWAPMETTERRTP